MAFIVADRVKETSTTTGTGTLDLAGAATGFQTFVAGIGTTNTCPYVIEDANGTAWEVGIGTVTDAAPDTLARTTLLASSTGSAISLSAGTHTVFCGWAANHAASSYLHHVAGTDADTTMAVGQMYVVDMSAWATADRTYTLPAAARVGDRIGIMVSAGDASHELKVTAASSDTLNGVAGGTEFTRLYARGDVLIMRCVTADSAWIVEYMGLQNGEGFAARGDGSTQVTLSAAGTTLVSSAAKTVEGDRRGEFNTTTGVWFPTRSGIYLISSVAIATGNIASGDTIAVYIEHSTDGSTWSSAAKRCLTWRGMSAAASGSLGGAGAYVVDVNGTTDRFRVTVYFSGADTSVKVPGSAANADWIRFSAQRIKDAL